MDTVTHGIAGSIFARMLADRPTARAAFVLGLVASMLPDVDILFAHDKIDYLRNHRGWTHAFVLLPFFALALALVARLVNRYARHAPLATLFLFSAVGIASHIAFDWITSFGTMFGLPFTRRRYALDWVFIIDPIFTAIVSISLVAATIFRAKGRLVSTIGAALLLAYLALCATLHSAALRTWKRMDATPPGAKAIVLPQVLSPFRWLGLAERENEIHVAFFDIGPFAKGRPGQAAPRPPTRLAEVFSSVSDYYPPPEQATIARYAKPVPSPALTEASRLPEVRSYLDFARFPLATVTAEPNGTTTVSFQDLRFLPWFTGPWERQRGFRYRRQPFVYRVRLDRTGRAIERGFVGGTAD